MGANLEVMDSNGNTPLIIACIKSYNSLARLLIIKGANIEGSAGNVLLLVVCKNNNYFIVLDLIRAKVNLESTNSDEQTPLIIACINDNYTIVELLIKYGAKIDAVDISGKSAEMYTHNYRILKLLSKSLGYYILQKNYAKVLQICGVKAIAIKEQIADDQECPICLGTCDCKTTCNHYLCTNCYLTYHYLQTQNKKCSICRGFITNTLGLEDDHIFRG